MENCEGRYEVPNGTTTLSVRRFEPDSARRHIFLIHGACEHGGRYQEFAARAMEQGWGVVVPDLRGHGLSTGTRSHVHQFEEYLADANLVFEDARGRLANPQSPFVIVAHSTGALIAARLLQQQASIARAAVLLSPYFGLPQPVPFLKRQIGRLLSKVKPEFRFASNIDGHDLSRDPEIYERRKSDKLLLRSITARWHFEIEDAQQAAFEQATEFTTPMLMIQAGADKIVSAARSREWFDCAGSDDKRYIDLAYHGHELLNETTRAQTAGTILNWLDEQVPGTIPNG